MLDILFLGRMFPPTGSEEIRKKARVDMQDAANVLQWNLINGLAENGCHGMTVVSLLPIDSWPKHYKDAFIKASEAPFGDQHIFHSVGFCNVTYIKQLLSRHACDKAVKKWAKKPTEGKKLIFCYTCNNTLMRAVAAAKKVNPNIRAIQIIADITEFAANDNLSGVRKFYVNRQIRENAKLAQYIDGYVLLTRQMKDKLNIEKPFVVMEGIVPERKDCAAPPAQSNKKTVLYTGSMNKKYGILTLLDAFRHIDGEEYELVLCGLGNAEPEISAAAQADPRIKYLGKVPHSEVLALQSQATVVVNPRQNNEEFTKYSFPSKTMEYLASGVPLVAYKLDGIPDEYDEHITYIPNNTPEAFADAIRAVCDMGPLQRKQRAEKAKAFVLREKNRVTQTKRILDFASALLD